MTADRSTATTGRTGAIRAARPAAITTARRNRVLGAALATCMVGGLAATITVQATAPVASAAAVEAPSVAELAAAAPQSYRADLGAAVTASSSRDDSVTVELEPTPTPTPAPTSPSGSGSSAAASGSAGIVGDDPASIKALAKDLLAEAGLSGQWSCFDYIITHESNWNPRAENASSGAYGLPQSLPGSKMASIADDWQTNPATQIKWAIGYMNAVYGSPCGAYNFWLANSHY